MTGWKMHPDSRYLLKMVIIHCHSSLLEGMEPITDEIHKLNRHRFGLVVGVEKIQVTKILPLSQPGIQMGPLVLVSEALVLGG